MSGAVGVRGEASGFCADATRLHRDALRSLIAAAYDTYPGLFTWTQETISGRQVVRVSALFADPDKERLDAEMGRIEVQHARAMADIDRKIAAEEQKVSARLTREIERLRQVLRMLLGEDETRGERGSSAAHCARVAAENQQRLEEYQRVLLSETERWGRCP